MSPKELLYIEDALGHEKQMKLPARILRDSFRTPSSKILSRSYAASIRNALTVFTAY